jgi:hypothetical protein
MQGGHGMANQDQLDILEQGIVVWNKWREDNPAIQPDLSGAYLSAVDLRRANLSEGDLRNTDLSGADLALANLNGANLKRADLRGAGLQKAELARADLSLANLRGARLHEAYLSRANLSKANLQSADLSKTYLSRADLTGANLRGAKLHEATMVETKLTEAALIDCSVYGISAWKVDLQGAIQKNLVITRWDEPTITVDNLKIAQFVYLLLNNAEIRDAIDTFARKAVLILGRFTRPRKAVLDALREALRTHGYLPILFDFDRPSSRNVTETVKTLAHLSRFIIADLTDPSSIPYELAQIVPGLAIPVQPVLLEGNRAFAMFSDLPSTYHWVLPTHYYADQAHLLATLNDKVIAPAEQKARELEKR